MNRKRNTIQRRIILDSVKELDIHATAEQVYENVVSKHPTISKATVYRNLARMAEAGEILNIGNLFGSVHYDHNCHEHYHFVCEECKRIFDVDDCFLDIPSRFTGMEGFEVTGHLLTFRGLCRDCNSKKNAPTPAPP